MCHNIYQRAFLYDVQYWGTARFSEIQEITIGQVIQKGFSFELIMSKCRGDKPKRRELALVHTTPRTFPRNICPVAILSAYLAARKRLAGAADSNFPNYNPTLNQEQTGKLKP